MELSDRCPDCNHAKSLHGESGCKAPFDPHNAVPFMPGSRVEIGKCKCPSQFNDNGGHG